MIIQFILLVLGQAAFFDELEPLYPDSSLADGSMAWVGDAAVEVPAGVHMLIDRSVFNPTRLAVEDGAGRPVAGISIYRLHDVPVEENTGLDSRTEQFKGDLNPHVIRRAPFRIYEAIEPLDVNEATVNLERGEGPLAFRLEYLPASPGPKDIRLVLHDGEQTISLPWRINVHDWKPEAGSLDSFGYTNWFSPSEIAKRHDVVLWSDSFWPILEQYARLMARSGQNTFWMRWPDFFERTGDGWTLNEPRLDRYIRIFFDAGLVRIEGAPIARRPGGDWSSPTLELSIPGVPAESKEGLRSLGELAGQLQRFMKERGWMGAWVQHIADEPTDVNAGAYGALSSQLRQSIPGVPIIEATMSRELIGAVDIWCPQVHKYQENREFFLERQAEGDEVWTYVCLVPGGPWLNRLMDQERLRSVYFAWAAERFDVEGFLHWGLNHYKADPFEQSVVDHPAMPNTTNKLPAGDTHVVFPGPDGPWSSTRLEAQRIGMEDLAALKSLKRRDPQAAEAIVGRIFRGYDDWEPDVEAYRSVRAELFSQAARPESSTDR
ncbi:MAG: hypothetical protein CMJ40_04455 [Phycisphaerae bacterium]|nr:hypothetical protein [Phycisphaerae bacterium]